MLGAHSFVNAVFTYMNATGVLSNPVTSTWLALGGSELICVRFQCWLAATSSMQFLQGP